MMKPELYPTSPEHLWQHFFELTQIPRPSGQEAQVRDYIIGLAKQQELLTATDSVGNLIVYVPASAGCDAAPTVAIQNHLDMVTVKTGDKVHDFTKDPLQLVIDGDWLKADRTTLGSDNGLGAAAALAVMTDSTLVHPALELIFTVEEETGLFGASGFDASKISATRLLNLDTEDWGEIYIGCAGGYGYEANRTFATQKPTPELTPWLLHLKGLSGGHSGVQVHEQLGNANKLLVELLTQSTSMSWQLSSFRGGVAHNVIAREASAVLMIDENDIAVWRENLEAAKRRWLSFLPTADENLEWVFEPASVSVKAVVSKSDAEILFDLVSVMPHGAQSYNLQQPADLVDLSCNLAVVNLRDGQLTLQTSLRFFNETQTVGLKQTFDAIFKAFQLQCKVILNYPGWNPDFNSALVARTQKLAREITGSTVELKAIHAGLECGILLSKKTDMDVVSFGPTIRGAHSPTERLQISTVEPFWQLLVLLLADLATDS